LHYISSKNNHSSGFCGIKEKVSETGEKYSKIYFQFINEGVTEKIARELYKNTPSFQKFFKKHYPQDDTKKEYGEQEIENIIKDIKAEIMEKNPNIKEEMGKAIEERDKRKQLEL
jgi:hypothetical protein